MKNNKSRRFKHGAVDHVYQRTVNGFNIFYDLSDYLVYFTIFCTISQRYDVIVYSICLMIDHIHCLVSSAKKSILSNFISNVTSVFVREYNSSIGRRGSLFEKRFGSAPKADRKKLVSAVIYLGNNPVEKKICTKAEQYRWNFLAYMNSTHPFSDPLVKYKASVRLKRAMNEVDRCCADRRYLNYAQLGRMMGRLTVREKNQLADYIITSYNVISYNSLLLYFESYSQLLVSMHSTTGTEFDLKEPTDRSSDTIYRDMIKIMRNQREGDVRSIIMSGLDEKLQIAELLHRRTGSPFRQVAKFLHLPLQVENSTPNGKILKIKGIHK